MCHRLIPLPLLAYFRLHLRIGKDSGGARRREAVSLPVYHCDDRERSSPYNRHEQRLFGSSVPVVAGISLRLVSHPSVLSLIPTYFLDSVAAIGERGEDGSVDYVATAFLFGHPVLNTSKKRSYFTFVVTNRHVVDPHRQLWIRFRAPTVDQDAKPFPVPIDAPPPSPWLHHPDPDIDLAVLPLDAIPIPSEFQPNRFLTLDRHAITNEELRASECSEGNEVFILGFPLGIAGAAQNDVIVRHGIVARIQDWYSGRSKDFLVDSSIYPGNSGGPVVLKPVLWSASNRPKVFHPRLLGLVASYLPYRDVATSRQTGRIRLVSEENSGLAKVIPIDSVIEMTSALAGAFDDSQGGVVTWDAMKAAVDGASMGTGL